MEFFTPGKFDFQFTKYFKIFAGFSLLCVLVSLVLLVAPGLNYGIDFRGGVEAHVAFKNNIDAAELRSVLDPKLSNVSIVNFSADASGRHEFLVTAQSESRESVTKTLDEALTAKYGAMGPDTWTVERMDMVGAKVGANLKRSAILSLIYTCLLVSLYMYWRFDSRFTPGALACVFHDLIVVSGVIALTHMEFSTTLVAALLTLAGYSINDTVVVFDRIREIEGKFLGKSREELVNHAITSTISRTIMTSATTLVSCIIIYLKGGPTLRDFATVLFVGIVVGTYSTVFVSTPLFLWADKKFGTGASKPALKAGRA
ncbi:MAG: protein translocase subunit SecF [Bdellovibrionota bacterium]